MIFFLLLVLNTFLVMIQGKAIDVLEQSTNRTMLRLTEVILGAHLIVCAGALLAKITYHHSLATIIAALPVAIGGILSVIMTLLPKTIKIRYPRISFFRNDRKIIFD